MHARARLKLLKSLSGDVQVVAQSFVPVHEVMFSLFSKSWQ